MIIQGSTNDGAGGSVCTYIFGGNGIELNNVVGIDVKNLTIRNALAGVREVGRSR